MYDITVKRKYLIATYALLTVIVLLVPVSAYAIEPIPTPDVKDIPESEVDKVIDFATVEQKNVSNDEIDLTLKNEGRYQIRNWSIVFNADFKVNSILGAELVSDTHAVQFKHLGKNAILNPGDTVLIKLFVGKGDKEIERFRIYAACTELSEDYQVNDVISYDCETGEEKLMTSDEEETVFQECGNEIGYEEECDIDNSLLTRSDLRISDKLISYARGISDKRTLVNNVNITPYRSIAFLKLYFYYSDNARHYGTAFMIGNRHALTSAHNVYADLYGNKRRLVKSTDQTLVFGLAGKKWKQQRIVRIWRVSAAYRANPVAANDWACLILMRPVNRAYFKLKQSNPQKLNNMSITTAGYPSDKAQPVTSENRYMYKASSRIYNPRQYTFRYKMFAFSGQSGSPLFGRNNYAYGIHSGYIGKYNSGVACYLNSSRVKYFYKMRWCGGRY